MIHWDAERDTWMRRATSRVIYAVYVFYGGDTLLHLTEKQCPFPLVLASLRIHPRSSNRWTLSTPGTPSLLKQAHPDSSLVAPPHLAARRSHALCAPGHLALVDKAVLGERVSCGSASRPKPHNAPRHGTRLTGLIPRRQVRVIVRIRVLLDVLGRRVVVRITADRAIVVLVYPDVVDPHDIGNLQVHPIDILEVV